MSKREGIPTIGCSLSFDFSDYRTTIRRLSANDYRLLSDYPTIDYWRVSVFLPVVWHGRADARDLVMFRGSNYVVSSRSRTFPSRRGLMFSVIIAANSISGRLRALWRRFVYAPISILFRFFPCAVRRLKRK